MTELLLAELTKVKSERNDWKSIADSQAKIIDASAHAERRLHESIEEHKRSLVDTREEARRLLRTIEKMIEKATIAEEYR